MPNPSIERTRPGKPGRASHVKHLRHVTPEQLSAIENSLNNRPRKILGFLTPAEVFEQLKLNHIAGVALQA